MTRTRKGASLIPCPKDFFFFKFFQSKNRKETGPLLGVNKTTEENISQNLFAFVLPIKENNPRTQDNQSKAKRTLKMGAEIIRKQIYP